MSRGGLLLRCARAGEQLPYAPVEGAVRHGPRPPGCIPRRRRLRGRLGGDAHRHLERQLAEGAAGEGALVARARAAGRAPDAGDEARRRATRRRTSFRDAGLRARPSRRGALERRRHRQPLRHRRTWSRTSASRCGPARTADAGDDEPLAEARMIAADLRRRARRLRLRAERPRGRLAVLRGEARLVRAARALARARRRTPAQPLVLGGDFNVAPDGRRRLGPARLPRRHPRLAAASARRSRGSAAGGSSTPTGCTTPSPAATPGGTTARATSTRTSACASTTCWSTRRSPRARVWAEIDREARKGKPIPSDHAPLVIDLDAPGRPFDAGWASAEGRIAARRAGAADGEAAGASRSSRPSSPCSRSSPTSCPTGDGWLFEPKWDGFRAIVFRDGDDVYIQSRDLQAARPLLPRARAASCARACPRAAWWTARS